MGQGPWFEEAQLDQIDLIETKAAALREKAEQDRYGIVWPGRAERAGI
jgi:hypothetical protein